MIKENKTSICLSKAQARMSEKERGTHTKCVMGLCRGFGGTCIYVSWTWLLVLVCKGCCSLVDNSWVVDNGQELIDNVRHKHLLIDRR